MRRSVDRLAYLFFPLVGIWLALQLPADRPPLRVLVVLVVSGLGVIAADAGFRLNHLRDVPASFRALRENLGRSGARTAAAFMVGSFVLLALSAITFSPDNNRDHNFTAPVVLLILGVISLWISLRYAAPSVEIPPQSADPVTPERGNLPLTLIGVLLLLLTGEIGGRALLKDLPRVSLVLQAIFFYGGIALTVMGLGGVHQISLPKRFRAASADAPGDVEVTVQPESAPAQTSRRRTYSAQAEVVPDAELDTFSRVRDWLTRPRSEVVIVALLFLGALLVRAWNLETGLRASIDEALAIDGVGHYYGGAIGLVARPSQYIPTLLFSQWQGIVLDTFGRSVTTLRIVSSIIGALTVVVTYFLARDLFKDRRLGLIAGLVLAVFPPHVHFSRIGLLHIADPLFGALAVWFLIRAVQSNRRLDWVLAGASLGMTQYFFEAGRLFYVPLVVVWLIAAAAWVILQRIRRVVNPPRIPVHGILIASLALVMVAMPTYYAAFSRGDDANPRLTTSGGFNLFTDPMQDGLTPEETTTLIKRVLLPFTVYVHQPEVAVFYGGDQPLMLVYVVPFFFMGTAYLLWRWRTMAFVIPLWILATALINALLRDSFVYARWHVVFPALAVTVAVALRILLPMIWSSIGDLVNSRSILTARRAAWLVGGVLVVMLVGQVVYYYQWHVPLLEKQARLFKPYPDVYDMAVRSFNFPDHTHIYQVSDPIADINVPRVWIGFMTKANPATLNYTPLAAVDFNQDYVTSLPRGDNLALFVDPRAADAIYLMRVVFGCEMQPSPYFIDPPDKAFLLCYVPAEPSVG